MFVSGMLRHRILSNVPVLVMFRTGVLTWIFYVDTINPFLLDLLSEATRFPTATTL